MKQYYILFALFQISFALYGQKAITGQVINSVGTPLPFVNITANSGKTGATTNLDGKFSLELNEPLKLLEFSYIGYHTLTLSGESLKTKLTITLEENVETLAEVTISPGVNPAHRIIKNTVAFADDNNPENLESFRYKAYSKFWVSFNLDSIDPSLDTVMANDLLAETDTNRLAQDTIARIDSNDYKMRQFFDGQHLFFMETLTERKFKSALRDNETVLAQRTSGFKNPMFALLVTQLQSFSFYNNYVGISGDEYLNPISKGSTQRYYFILEDTLYPAPNDTTFIISFRPKPGAGFKALKGVLSINSTDWAIVNVRAQPASTESLPVIIQQAYQRYGKHTWFPVAFKADIDLKMVSINKAQPKAIMRRGLMDIEINPTLKRRDIPLAELTVTEESTAQKANDLLNTYRKDSLTAKEQRTYGFMDSISTEAKLEQRLDLLLALSRGYVPYKAINIDLGKIVNYNTYEGFRLGLGLTTNRKFSKWLNFGGYFAYGFKDKRAKYGLNTRIDILKNLGFSLAGGLSFDIAETGGFEIPGREKIGLSQDNYRRLFIEQWDQEYQHYTALRIDPLPFLRYELRGQVSRRRSLGNYRFGANLAAADDFSSAQRGFTYTQIINTVRFAPKEKHATTPFGKISLGGASPVIWLSYTRGLAGAFNGDFNFDKLQLSAQYRKKTLRLGTATFGLNAGTILQDLPYAQNFVGTTNGITSNNFWERSEGLADRNSFETMRFNEFMSDTYFELMWRQDFKTLLYRGEKFRPHLELVNRLAFGTLRNPNLHQGLNFKTLEHGFFESGIEFNRLWSSNFAGIGFGFYYRYGANTLPGIENNIALKLTSKFAL